jgi:uncharacterized protein
MSRDFPDWISPDRAAEGKRIFSGTIPLKRMKRLSPLLVSADGDATFSATFKRDIEKRVVIDLRVEADLPLICQASLEVYDEKVQRHSELAVIDEDEREDQVPDYYDAVRSEHGRVALAALVEEELLLSLPQIPRKPGLAGVEFSTGELPAEKAAKQTEGKSNPFAALQDMLERKKQD